MDQGSGFLNQLTQAVNSHGMAAGMAFLLSWLRIQYDGKEPRPLRRLIEALLGSAITVAVGLTAESFGMSSGWSFAAAGMVGVVGVDFVRDSARKWAAKKVDQ